MAQRRINIVMPVPQVELKLFGSWHQVSNMIDNMPKSVLEGYNEAIRKASKNIIKIVRTAIRSGTPPAGARWPALSPNTIKVHGQHNIYHLRGVYERSINVYRYKDRTIVGLPINSYVPGKNITLNQLAVILEHGSLNTGNGAIPPRPLWGPSYKVYGGNEKLKRAIMKEIRSRLFKDFGLNSNKVKATW